MTGAAAECMEGVHQLLCSWGCCRPAGCCLAGMGPHVARLRAPHHSQAWKEAQPEIEKSKRYGTWLRDTFFSGPDDSGRWCHIAEIK